MRIIYTASFCFLVGIPSMEGFQAAYPSSIVNKNGMLATTAKATITQMPTTFVTTTSLQASVKNIDRVENKKKLGRSWNVSAMFRNRAAQLKRFARTMALAVMLFLAPLRMHTMPAQAAQSSAVSTTLVKSGAADRYIRKYLFKNDGYALFDTAIREPDGQAIDAIPGIVDSSMGQPLSDNFGTLSAQQNRSEGVPIIQLLKNVLGLAIVFGALPVTMIVVTSGWKFITDFGERVTYGKDKSVGKDTYSAYDATEKNDDDDDSGDDEDGDYYDPENPDE
mmetsp:Transcript_22078/g.28394  ORF Transcript_22078/g.28394 Transcript_22078/m.28394 type:complete len:279 (-) Transcript_22078:161-997(-)